MDKFWKWSKAEVSSDTNKSELILEGVIASESWWGDEVTPAQFREELKNHSGDLTVRINSPGGDVYAGVSIYNALTEHDGKVTVKVDGVAASIASVIAMAGDNIVMNPGAMMMIHKPWTVAMGNSDDLEEAAAYLKKVGSSIVPIYTERTGQTEEKVNELLDAETWMTASEAVELGFADEAIKPKSNLSDAVNNALNYLKPVNSALMQPVMSIKTKLEAAHEAENVKEVTDVPTNTTEEPEEVVQPEAPVAPETETEEVTETPAEVEPINPVEPKEPTIMEDNKTAIASDQVIAPQSQAKPEAAKAQNYLKTPSALEDFASVLQANAGKGFEDVKSAWKDILVKNGLTDADYFRLPDPVVTSIEDAVKTSGIYNALNHTGLDVFRVDWDDTDSNADASRAGGHTKGDTKTEQTLDFDKRVIRAQFIYKYLTLNKEDIRENRSSGALMRFVLNELPQRVLREIERAVIIGDGRANDADRKITSFVSVKADAATNSGAGNTFATTYTPEAGESHYDTLVKAADLLEAEGPVYLIAKKGYTTAMKLERVNGQLVFPTGTNVADALGFAGEFKPTWFNDTTDAANDAYLVVLSAYKTVGDNSVESFTNFKLETNKNEFLQEIYKGGALASRRAAVAIAKTPAEA